MLEITHPPPHSPDPLLATGMLLAIDPDEDFIDEECFARTAVLSLQLA